jgi:membrane protein implicated in regulation of membrane protease activity
MILMIVPLLWLGLWILLAIGICALIGIPPGDPALWWSAAAIFVGGGILLPAVIIATVARVKKRRRRGGRREA